MSAVEQLEAAAGASADVAGVAQFGAHAEPVRLPFRARKVYGTKAGVQLRRKYFRLLFINSSQRQSIYPSIKPQVSHLWLDSRKMLFNNFMTKGPPDDIYERCGPFSNPLKF